MRFRLFMFAATMGLLVLWESLKRQWPLVLIIWLWFLYLALT